jgi:tRNA dimethylallyltransferase
MGIGTAKPDKQEMRGVKHHFVDSLSIHDRYTAADFERDGLHAIDTLHQSGKLPVVAGGSGLYVKALLEGLDDLPHDGNLRAELNTIFAEKGLAALQKMLLDLDASHFALVDKSNPMRLIRSIELIKLSGKRMSELRNKQPAARKFKAVKIGLTMPREVLYERIDQRVEMMLQAGLVEEAKQLYPHRALQALQTVGYTELFAHFEGSTSLDHAISLIKRNSRRYAKRQLTWLRKDEDIHWFHPHAQDEIVDFVKKEVQRQP